MWVISKHFNSLGKIQFLGLDDFIVNIRCPNKQNLQIMLKSDLSEDQLFLFCLHFQIYFTFHYTLFNQEIKSRTLHLTLETFESIATKFFPK